MVNDLRYAFRMLCKNPGFSAVVVLTLAVGIGGNTAIFSLLYNGFIDPFDIDSRRLVYLMRHDSRIVGAHNLYAVVSGRELLDYEEQNKIFDEVVGTAGEGLLVKRADGAVNLNGSRVTASLFRVLGVPMLRGRALAADDARPGAPPVAVLGFKAWRTHFGEDPAAVGKTFVVNDRPTTVIGVMPPGAFPLGEGDLLLPAAPARDTTADPFKYRIVGRLRPGVSMQQANADVTTLAKRFAVAYPQDHPKEITFRVEPVVTAFSKNFRDMLFFLQGAVGLLLLITCSNVANMFSARATEREKELAIRASLGASRWQLFRQLIVESLLLATCGSIAGVFLAVHLITGLLAVIPPLTLGVEEAVRVRINGPVLLFAVGVTLICTLISGLVPALRAVGRHLEGPLKAASRSGGQSSRHRGLQNLVVASEAALSLVLLTGAGLLMRSFIAVSQVELGFDPDHVIGVGLQLPKTRYSTPEQRIEFQLEALHRLRALPGVASAALTMPTVMLGGPQTAIEISGKPSADKQLAYRSYCSDGCLETRGIPLLAGRTFSEADVAQRRTVAIVNRSFANKFLKGLSPLGERVKLKESEDDGRMRFSDWHGPVDAKTPWFEVIGVAGDIRGRGPESPIVPQMYIPYTFAAEGSGFVFFSLRTGTDTASMQKSVQQVIWSMDRNLPVFPAPGAFRDVVRRFLSGPRFVMTLSAAFASLGLLLVSIGVYSVLSYTVSRRTQEIGIRMALGAQATDVRRMVMMSGLRWLGVGIGIGVPASIALARILQNRIWGIKSADASTLIAVSLLMTVVGLAACYFPSRRATKVDPMVALRYE